MGYSGWSFLKGRRYSTYVAVYPKLDAGWPESEEEQVGNVKLEEEVTRIIRIDRQEERQTYLDR